MIWVVLKQIGGHVTGLKIFDGKDEFSCWIVEGLKGVV